MRALEHTYFLSLAYMVSARATCNRLRVGAVIVNQQKRVVSMGFNGSTANAPHCLEVGCEIVLMGDPPKESCVRTLHAESNALDYAGREARGCAIFCTALPCIDCAKRIANSGIYKLVYHQYYESRAGLSYSVPEYLIKNSVVVVQYTNPEVEASKKFVEDTFK